MLLKFGRKPARRTERTEASRLVMEKMLLSLGSPPVVSSDYVSTVTRQSPIGWGMMANNQWGCCVEADDAHYLMLRTANTGSIVVPTEDQVLALYSAETGFNPNVPSSDQGTDETSDCEFMVTTGFLGHKADATGFVNPDSVSHLKWCVQLFGGVKFGLNFPQSAMDQFNAGKPWTVVANDGGIIGGHDVLGVKYDGQWFYAVTWGALQPVEPLWLLKYADEAHVLVFLDWFNSIGTAPSGFNLRQLLADLPAITSDPSADDHRHHHWRRKRWRQE